MDAVLRQGRDMLEHEQANTPVYQPAYLPRYVGCFQQLTHRWKCQVSLIKSGNRGVDARPAPLTTPARKVLIWLILKLLFATRPRKNAFFGALCLSLIPAVGCGWEPSWRTGTGFPATGPQTGRLILSLYTGNPTEPSRALSRRGMQIMHKCDVRSCVNPDHLQVGTHLENMADMRAKGRQPKCDRRGCHNGRAKLDDARALEIWLSEHRPAIIAKIYGVSRCTVNDIKKMRTWQHIHPRPAST